jgi:hypothetical protein
VKFLMDVNPLLSPPADLRPGVSFDGRFGGSFVRSRAIGWEQDSVTPISSISRAMTPIATPSESVADELKDQSSA